MRKRNENKMTSTQSATLLPETTLRAHQTSRLLRVVAGLTLVALGTIASLSAGGATRTNLALNEFNNGKVVVVTTGSHITITLHSTYWTLAPLTNHKVLAQQGSTHTAPRLPASANGCVPGQGCGTVTAHFLATGSGQIRLRASRTSCGEAMRCTPIQSVWSVVIRVR
jgi:hypothetical protein